MDADNASAFSKARPWRSVRDHERVRPRAGSIEQARVWTRPVGEVVELELVELVELLMVG